MRIMFLGDMHGDTATALYAIRRARALGVDRIIQLGDFGYWPHETSGLRYLDAIDRELAHDFVELWFIDGNHENHDLLTRDHADNPRVRPRIRWLRRGERFTAGGLKFVAAGGAASIDRHYRVEGDSWWAGEVVTDADADLILAGGPADVVISHDAPTFATYLDNPDVIAMLTPDVLEAVNRSRENLTRAVQGVGARLVIHGHWHIEQFAPSGFEAGGGWVDVNVLGLGANVGADQYFLAVDVDDGRMVTGQDMRGLAAGSDPLAIES